MTFLVLSEWTSEFNERQRTQLFRIGRMGERHPRGQAVAKEDQYSTRLIAGVTVAFSAIAASNTDLLALRGLKTWRRSLLLPWLFLYAFAISLILAYSLAGIFHHGFRWIYLILMVCSLCLYSAWRHIRAQYAEMARERPSVRTIEELAADIRETANTVNRGASGGSDAEDLPPKYEDLEQPPVYEEVNEERSRLSQPTDANRD